MFTIDMTIQYKIVNKLFKNYSNKTHEGIQNHFNIDGLRQKLK